MSVVPQKKSGFIANLLEILMLLSIVFLVRTFVFGLYQVPTGSMETTMLVGERFYADKFFYLFRDPQRNEVIAFNEPPAYYNYSDNKFYNMLQQYIAIPFVNWGPSNWTKRVIGQPGDTVEGKIEDGKAVIYLNGKKLDEPYLNKYPIAYVFKEDPIEIQEKVRRMYQPLLFTGRADIVERLENQELEKHIVPKTYDPSVGFDKQPFYNICPSRIMRDPTTGSFVLIYPNSPTPAKASQQELIKEGKNSWGNGADEFLVHLGPDEYWVMGDNRKGSKDCRVFGPIKRDLIHGRIVFRIWSIDSDESWWIIDLIKHPIDFWCRVRWSRFFQIIR